MFAEPHSLGVTLSRREYGFAWWYQLRLVGNAGLGNVDAVVRIEMHPFALHASPTPATKPAIGEDQDRCHHAEFRRHPQASKYQPKANLMIWLPVLPMNTHLAPCRMLFAKLIESQYV
jgi:hypothetical protein